MTALLITFGIIALIFLIHYIMYKRNSSIPNTLEFETLRTYRKDPAYYEENESDVQKSRI